MARGEMLFDCFSDPFLGVLEHGAEEAFLGSDGVRRRRDGLVLFLFFRFLELWASCLAGLEKFLGISHLERVEESELRCNSRRSKDNLSLWIRKITRAFIDRFFS